MSELRLCSVDPARGARRSEPPGTHAAPGRLQESDIVTVRAAPLIAGSGFGKSSKGLLCVHVPLHSRHGMSPSVLHALPGALVCFITGCDHFFQMAVLRLYDFISRIPMEWRITWSTHLLTCHCFHVRLLLLVRGSVASSALKRPPSSRARRSSPRRRRSAPSERRRSAT